MLDTGAPGCQFAYVGTDCGYNVQTLSGDGATVYGELAHLSYKTLGNLGWYDTQGVLRSAPGGDAFNWGPFMRIIPDPYWQTVINPPSGADAAWIFVPGAGAQGDWDLQLSQASQVAWVIAVHDGDIAAAILQIPEPATVVLMGLGLAALILRAARDRRGRLGPRLQLT